MLDGFADRRLTPLGHTRPRDFGSGISDCGLKSHSKTEINEMVREDANFINLF